jgi:hypothetical protein
MSCPPQLWPWQKPLSSAFPRLSKPQASGLAWWSAGMALTGSVGISQISALLALVLGQKEGTVSQRLREWYLEAHAKWGGPRRDLEVTTCFGPLLGWLVRLLGDAEHRLALALDATTLGDRWTVLQVEREGRVDAPFLSPGRCFQRMPKARGVPTGKGCWSDCKAVCLPIGW